MKMPPFFIISEEVSDRGVWRRKREPRQRFWNGFKWVDSDSEAKQYPTEISAKQAMASIPPDAGWGMKIGFMLMLQTFRQTKALKEEPWDTQADAP